MNMSLQRWLKQHREEKEKESPSKGEATVEGSRGGVAVTSDENNKENQHTPAPGTQP